MPESYTITVNGQVHETSEDKSLLRYLRNNLKLKSVKDGCSEGACGTCTIIVDGKATRACTLTTKRADGKTVVTTEGLTPEEREAFVYAFGVKGAVQCGFCTPGMIMSAKALLDENPEPKKEEIQEALGGNICRCTGYVNIERAVEAAAERMRKGE